MIKINLKEGLEKAQTALDAGMLAAQVDTEDLQCEYRTKRNYPCVVGAMFSDEDWRAHIDGKEGGEGPLNKQAVAYLVNDGVIVLDVDLAAGRRILSGLQTAHDDADIGALRQRLTEAKTWVDNPSTKLPTWAQ